MRQIIERLEEHFKLPEKTLTAQRKTIEKIAVQIHDEVRNERNERSLPQERQTELIAAEVDEHNSIIGQDDTASFFDFEKIDWKFPKEPFHVNPNITTADAEQMSKSYAEITNSAEFSRIRLDKLVICE